MDLRRWRGFGSTKRGRGERMGGGGRRSRSRRLIRRFRSRRRLLRGCWRWGCRAGLFVRNDILGVGGRAVTSFEPRPNPDITSPSMRRGKGVSGPESGPTIVGRGARGADAGAGSEDDIGAVVGGLFGLEGLDSYESTSSRVRFEERFKG